MRLAAELPSVPTSRATRVTSSANDESWSTIVLIVFLSSRISPRASTVIFFDRSPVATAVVTSAMFRTWSVRFDAMPFTLCVSWRHVPETSFTSAWPPRRPSVPTSRRDARDLVREGRELVDHGVDRVLELEHLALDVDRDLLREVAERHRGRDLGDVPHLAREVAGEGVDVVGEVLPGAADALDLSLAAEHSLVAHFLGDARDLVCEGRELVDHRVDRVLQLEDLARERRR